MAGRIQQDFIDDLLARTDIVEIIDSRVSLKKAGKNYQACCPFHNEKTPSFTVSPDKQFYHCFGCGAHGNAIGFLMEYERFEFVEAIEELASMAGIEVRREESKGQSGPRKPSATAGDFELMENLAKFFRHQLKHHDNSSKAIDYLKGRGLSGEVVHTFGIGYAPPEWDAMHKAFGGTQDQDQQLLDLGMLTQNERNRRYDRFRDRIMFPIRNKRGKVIGFGGRVLENKEGTPKYLNSPETRIFHKGLELYGLYEIRQAHKKLEKVVVVEGYMDVVALAQYGIDYAVASLGTSTTREQLQSLFRATEAVICCYDGDRAGREAAWRALENALPLLRDGVELKFVFLPDGEDPDSMVRQKGTEEFERLLDKAQPLSDFFFENLISQVNMASTDGKAKLAQLALPLLARLPDGMLQEMLRTRLAQMLGVDPASVQKLASGHADKTNTAQVKQPKRRLSLVATALALLLHRPQLAQSDIAKYLIEVDALADLNFPGVPLLRQVLVQASQGSLSTAQILERWRDQAEGKQLGKLVTRELHIEAEHFEDVFSDTIEKLLDEHVKQRTEALLNKERTGELDRDEKRELWALLNAQQSAGSES